MIISGIVELAFLILIGYLVYRAVRGRSQGDGRSAQEAGASLRRFFQYGSLFALVALVASGVAGLVGQVLLQGDDLVVRDETGLARSLAFVIVGAPALAGLGRWLAHRLRRDAAERRSFAVAAYLSAMLSVSLLITGFALFRTLRWAFGESDFDPSALGWALAWGAVWAVHALLAGRHEQPARLQLGRLFGAAAGLAGTATAAGYGLGVVLTALYDEAFRTVLVAAPADGVRVAVAGLAVAGPAWWWHWLGQERHGEQSPAWHAYVLLVGVLGGLLTTLIASGTALFLLLQWAVGEPEVSGAGGHFSPLPAAVAGFVAGAAVWAYHRLVLRPDGERSEVDRAYGYLISAVGLAAAAGGVAALLAALVDAIVPKGGALVEAGGGDALAAALTFVGVGVPVWAWHWLRAQRYAVATPAEERRSPSRRTYLYVTLGVAGAVALVSALVTLVIGLEDALDGTFGWATVRDLRVGLALVVVAGAGAAAHGLVLRTDRALEPAQPRAMVRDVLLVSADGAGLADALAHEVGARVRTWQRLDTAPGPVAVDDVVAAVRAETHPHLVVITTPDGGFEVVPVDFPH